MINANSSPEAFVYTIASFRWALLFGLMAIASFALIAAPARGEDPPKQKSIFDDNPPPASTTEKPARPVAPVAPTPTPTPAPNASGVIADTLLIVADDFVTDIYQNGQRVPDAAYKLEGEIFGATVMRVRIEVHAGDSLVFNVANDRFRWGGSVGLSVAGLRGDDRSPAFVTEAESGNWSGCDALEQAPRFIKEPAYLHEKSAVVPSKAWRGCTEQMKKRCDWSGETLWADSPSRNVWIRYVAPK